MGGVTVLFVVHVRYRNEVVYTRLQGTRSLPSVPTPGARVPIKDRQGASHLLWIHRATFTELFGSFVSLENTISARALRIATAATLPDAVPDHDMVALDALGAILWPVGPDRASLPVIGKLTAEQQVLLDRHFKRLTGG